MKLFTEKKSFLGVYKKLENTKPHLFETQVAPYDKLLIVILFINNYDKIKQQIEHEIATPITEAELDNVFLEFVNNYKESDQYKIDKQKYLELKIQDERKQEGRDPVSIPN